MLVILLWKEEEKKHLKANQHLSKRIIFFKRSQTLKLERGKEQEQEQCTQVTRQDLPFFIFFYDLQAERFLVSSYPQCLLLRNTFFSPLSCLVLLSCLVVLSYISIQNFAIVNLYNELFHIFTVKLYCTFFSYKLTYKQVVGIMQQAGFFFQGPRRSKSLNVQLLLLFLLPLLEQLAHFISVIITI